MQSFKNEAEFENALIQVLSQKGWEEEILHSPNEDDLIKNWASILFDNNREIDRLNNIPLTDGEMQQILEQIKDLKTPLKLNSFINGKTVAIKRDNPEDALHFGKEVSLKIYDKQEIAAGQSRYQIVQQPRFQGQSSVHHDRRGDVMLLINGMPVIHIELKRSNVPVSYAYNQIEKYTHENIFSGIFSLIQIFVAMTPEESLYFANPGAEGVFNTDYYFHWADYNNEPMNNWKYVASTLLSIPMAHQMIGFYTIADTSDGILKVMRSYQYYAAAAISDVVSKTDWNAHNQRGGFIWHTTGSGKTMTSFKSAQLIASSKDADKVLFLMDRVELGTQSLKEYRAFADEGESVQATENTEKLLSKLKSTNPAEVLIVTSIQKMSNLKEDYFALKPDDLAKINSKRLVFIVDEAHRSTFGDMLKDIRASFTDALFFGFTGTPIHEENQKNMNTTQDIFGDERHRYSIADGIRDKNVLGFDTYKILTFRDKDLREVIALEQAKAKIIEEVLADSKKSKIYYQFMDSSKIKMAGFLDDNGKYCKGIEDYIPNAQYEDEEHQNMVVKNIKENWLTLSHGGKFHALFATSSILEAIEYYRHFKKEMPELKVTCLFDPNIDNCGDFIYKEEGLVEIIEDYNTLYKQNYSLASHASFKKDIALRLAHKKPYERIKKEEEIDILIVVDQMLTGFDSKWINTLYLDKLLKYENIIQAFSRTNRLFGHEKPFGTIRYFRKPHTMEQNIEKAIKLYSGDKPLGLFVEKLPYNIKKINAIFQDISELFQQAKIEYFSKLPQESADKAKFASLFKGFNAYLNAATIQGFTWEQSEYTFKEEDGEEYTLAVDLDQNTYLSLVQRYKELASGNTDGGDGTSGGDDVPYDITGYLTEIDTGAIDADYMNQKFEKYLKALFEDEATEAILEEAKNELHKSFASLSSEMQKYANLFLHDVQRGEVKADSTKSFNDYITEYQSNAKNSEIEKLIAKLGINEQGVKELRNFLDKRVTKENINEFGRFDSLKECVDKKQARAFFEEQEGTSISPPKLNIKINNLLREFILDGGFDVEE